MTVRALPICPPTLTLPPEATVAEAMSMMIQREVNHIPLCAADGRFIGLISSKAILRAMLPADARDEADAADLDDALSLLIDHLHANDRRAALELADTEVETVAHDTPVLAAARKLSRTTASLPVVAKDGRLLGMLSRNVLLTHLLDQAQAVTMPLDTRSLVRKSAHGTAGYRFNGSRQP